MHISLLQVDENILYNEEALTLAHVKVARTEKVVEKMLFSKPLTMNTKDRASVMLVQFRANFKKKPQMFLKSHFIIHQQYIITKCHTEKEHRSMSV